MSGSAASAAGAAAAVAGDNKAPAATTGTDPPAAPPSPSSSSSSSSAAAFAINVLKAFLLCAVFMLVGPALILLNKYIMQKLPFPYPMFLSGLGVFTSYLFSYALIAAGVATVEKKAEVEGARFYTRVLPVGIAHAGTLATGNWVYLLLDVGFIQMLKSFTPVVVMFFLFLFNIEVPTKAVTAAILIISFGTAMTCSFTPNASLAGLAVMLLSEVCEAIRLVLTQFLLKDMRLGVIEGQYVLSPASAGCLFAMSLFVEVPTMIKTGHHRNLLLHWPDFVAVSLCGLVINFLSYFVIQVTSSLTLKVLVMIRNVLVIIVGIIVYGEQTSTNEFVGYVFALVGFVLYNMAKMNAFEPRKGATTTTGTGKDIDGGGKKEAGDGAGGDRYVDGTGTGDDEGGGSVAGWCARCMNAWPIFRLGDLESQTYRREAFGSEVRRSHGIYPGSSPSSTSMLRLANLTGGKQRNLQSFSKDSDNEEDGAGSGGQGGGGAGAYSDGTSSPAAGASETSRLLGGGGPHTDKNGSGGSGGSSLSWFAIKDGGGGSNGGSSGNGGSGSSGSRKK